MHPIRSSATALAALTLAALPATAVAHDGGHPFKSCAEAYANGYSDISGGDDHYGPQLDPDGDGIACDQPPADFTPRDNSEVGGDIPAVTATATSPGDDALAGSGTGDDGDSTVQLAIVGASAAVFAVGAALLVALVRRR